MVERQKKIRFPWDPKVEDEIKFPSNHPLLDHLLRESFVTDKTDKTIFFIVLKWYKSK